MLDFAAPWCEIPSGPTERQFPEYPDESLADWDERHGLRDAPDDGFNRSPRRLRPDGSGKADLPTAEPDTRRQRMERTI
jgi:hypothetical protein